MKIKNLRTQGLIDPLGITYTQPLLSWQLEQVTQQTAFQLRYQTQEGIWRTTDKIFSRDMHFSSPHLLTSREKVTWQVRVWNEEDQVSSWSTVASYEAGLMQGQDWQAAWIDPELEINEEEHQPASYLRKKFSLSSLKGQARLYITARGLYEAWLNGQRVGQARLSPGSSTYHKRLAVQTYDVSDLLVEGENEFIVLLGDGWYRGVSGVDGVRNLYGTRLGLLAQLELDGHPLVWTDADWQASQEGPIRYNDLQQGERVDLRRTEPCDWHPVSLSQDQDLSNLCGSNSPEIQEQEAFHGKIIQTPNGQKVIDFGQNLAGYVAISGELHQSGTLRLVHGESLDHEGNFTIENFQDRERHKEGGIRQEIVLQVDPGKIAYQPRFSIFGFRYALIDTDLDLKDLVFTAKAVYSKMGTIGKLQTSSSRLNQLVQNIHWSMKSNFVGIPTDCPTRERAAWTGDIGIFIDTALYFEDCTPVIRDWLAECRINQQADGKVPNIVPPNNQPNFFSNLLAGSVGWGDAVILVPYAIYQRTMDLSILEENYSMMKAWVGFLESRAKQSPDNQEASQENLLEDYTINTGVDYGEWCEPGGDNRQAMAKPQSQIATAYFAHSAKLLSQIAMHLGQNEEAAYYRDLADKAKQAYRQLQLTEGRIVSPKQADYVRALAFGLLEAEEAKEAAADLNALVVQNDYCLNTGFLATPYLCQVLADYGYVDTAFRLLFQEKKPSWLYAVSKGATTIWESWDGINEEGVVKDSLNHYAYGAIAAWLYRSVAGIQINEGRLTIKPLLAPQLDWVEAAYQSPLGLVESRYKKIEDKIRYEISIPSNTQAEFVGFYGHKQVLSPGNYVIEELIRPLRNI